MEKIAPTSGQPVFVVGLPRSGTTLLAAMLAAHSRFSCGSETHFFRKLAPDTEYNICSDPSWPNRAVDYLFSLRLGESHPVPVYYELTREMLAGHLRDKERTLASVAAAMPELHMQKLGKTRWAEKTPDHLMYTDRIRKYFPDALIIRIRRDPRDVSSSMVKVPWGPETFLEALNFCQHYHDTFEDVFKTDPNTYTVHYEALITSPEAELHKLCAFLGERFEPYMLNTEQAAANVKRTNEEAWKTKVAEKVDKSRANAWKDTLTAEQKRQADAIIGGFTAEKEALARQLPIYIELCGYAGKNDSGGLKLLNTLIQESPVRFWPASAAERPMSTLFLGTSESAEWLGYGSHWQRFKNALAITVKIIQYRLSGHRYAWPWMASNNRSNMGFCTRLVAITAGRKTTNKLI